MCVRDRMFQCCLMMIFCYILQAGSLPCDDELIAFSGGFLSVRWHSTSTSFRKITFDFKPAHGYNAGVLFFMKFRLSTAVNASSSVVSMLSYNHSSLILSTQQSQDPVDSVVIGTVSNISSNTLYLHIRNNALRIKLENAKWRSYRLKGMLSVTSLLFGGTDDFTVYPQFPVRRYFVGVLTNLNMGQECVSIVHRNELSGRQAVVQNHCATVISPFVEFNAFSHTLASVTVQPVNHLRIGFMIATKTCVGEIMHLSGGGFVLGLSNGRLITRITNSTGHSKICVSTSVISGSEWTSVVIDYHNSRVKYIINEEENSVCHTNLDAVDFNGTLVVGARLNVSVPFVGYLRHLFWDDSEVNLAGMAMTEQACVGVGPVRCELMGFDTAVLPSCPSCTLRNLPIQWTTFNLSVGSNLTVNESLQRIIVNTDFNLSFVGSQCLTNASLHSLHRNLIFTLQKPYPAHGTVNAIHFSFEDINMKKVHYDHSGTEEESDVLYLLVQVYCGLNVLYERLVSMHLLVNSINDPPTLELPRVLYVVVGTRQLITSSIIKIIDSDTSLEQVHFTDAQVGISGNSVTGQFEWTGILGLKVTEPFYQSDIDAGRITLRLFLNATGTSLAALTVFDGIAENHRNFKVYGTSGLIRVMQNNSVKVVEHLNVPISKSQLSAGTNFSNQKPLIIYMLDTFPRFGELILVLNQSLVVRNVSHFTQQDIDMNKLFYSHIQSVQNSTEDCFHFQLMVDDFKGDNGSYCVNIVIRDHLPKLVLNISIAKNITLLEGEEILVFDKNLVVYSALETLNGEVISIPDDFVVELLFMEVPKYGILYLNSSNVTTPTVMGGSVSLEQFMSGSLIYSHTQEEEHVDSFKVKLVAKNFSHLPIQPPDSNMEYAVFVVITPVNNNYPQIRIYSNFSIMEGGHGQLLVDVVNVTDADRPHDNLTVFVTPLVASNGYFAYRKNNSVAISSFLVSEMNQDQIIFVHQLGSKLVEEYLFVVSDGMHNSSEVLRVIADPVKLNVSTTHSTERCSLHLDLLHSSMVQIHNGLFSIELSSDDLPNVEVTTMTDSNVYFKNSTNFFSVAKFFKHHIDQGFIWYVVNNTKTRIEKNWFDLTFSIGHAEPVGVIFQVCLNVLPYPKLLFTSSLLLSLPEGGDIVVSSSDVSATNTRNHASSYDLNYDLIVPPTNGELQMSLTSAALHFSQEDINRGSIRYYNHNYSSSGDEFVLSLSNQFYKHTENITVTVNVYLLRLRVVNNGFRATEGGNHSISTNELHASGPPGYLVMFKIDSAPTHGNIYLGTNQVSSFSQRQLEDGLVVYVNDDEEFLHDSMNIRITAVQNGFTPAHIRNNVSEVDTVYFGTVNITIELVNDNAPRIWNDTTESMVDGYSLILTSYIISCQDDDIDMNISLLSYEVVSGPIHGYMFFVSNGSKVTRFLQQNIYNSEIGYQNKKSSTAHEQLSNVDVDIVAFSVSDGKHSILAFLKINVLPFIVEVVVNNSLSLDEGRKMAVLGANLLFEAGNAKPVVNDSEYIFNITTLPTHGRLILPDPCGCAFTQAELKNASVIYHHDDSDTVKDSFNFEVTVRGYKTKVMTFIITINAVDDEPPSVTYLDQLLVDFGGRVYFNKSILLAADSEADLSNLVFTVVKKPTFGSIKFEKIRRIHEILVVQNFTQVQVNEEAIFYQHENTEVVGEWIDTVELSLADGRNRLDDIVIKFILIPDILPIRVTGMSLIEGSVVPLPPNNIEVTHPYLSTFELYINVTQRVDYGVLLSLYESDTVYFNSTALNNGSILYFNQDDLEVAEAMFKFVATAHGLSSTEHNFVFTIISINDEVPVIIRNSVISLWAGEEKLISADDLFAGDSDAHPADELSYIIDTNTSLGHFAYKEASLIPVTRFLQDDIVAGIVLFNSYPTANDTELEINFTVTDGRHPVKSCITFEINILEIITVSSQTIMVNTGADQLINLSASTNDVDNVKREICYHILRPPRLGLVVDTGSSQAVDNFTQEQVNNKQIVYRHTAVNRWEAEDVVSFTVHTDLAESVGTSLYITVRLKMSSTSYLAASGSISVDEGGIACMNESVLDASNVLYEVWKHSDQSVDLDELAVRYFIITRPSHGDLLSGYTLVEEYFEHDNLKNAPGVCYHHNGSETSSDSFDVMIKIYNSTDEWYSNNTSIIIPVHIRAVNDEHPKLVRIVEHMFVFKYNNYTATIQPDELRIADNDTIEEELLYVVVLTDQSSVTCSLSDKPTINFTQSDIGKGRVKCTLPSSISSSNMTFYFTDGKFTSDYHTVQYSKTILTLGVPLMMVELQYPQQQGASGIMLTTQHLNSSTTGYRKDTLYTVISQPTAGNLIKAGFFAVLDNFTQSDIDNNMVEYIATNMTSYTDTFTLEVTNRHAEPLNVSVYLTALAMIETNDSSTITVSSIDDQVSLPPELFIISSLAANHSIAGLHFTVISGLMHGYLTLRSDRRSIEEDQPFAFSGSQLADGKVLYSLNNNLSNVTEIIQLLVKAEKVQAGFAELSFNVTIVPITTARPTTKAPSGQPSGVNGRGSGFTLFALVPIIGIPSFILMVMVILVGFWYSQKLKEKRRNVAARGSSAICMGPHSQFSLPRHTVITTEVDCHSDKQSSDHSSNNSDEGISMDDHIEDDGIARRYIDEQLRTRPMMDYASYCHPIATLHAANNGCDSSSTTINPQFQHVRLQKFPVLKNEEYWL